MAELRKLDLSCIESAHRLLRSLFSGKALAVIGLVLHDRRGREVEHLPQGVPIQDKM